MPIKDPEKRKAWFKAYRERRGDELRAHDRAYDKANRVRRNANKREWRKANPEKELASQAAYRSRHPDRIKAYREANRERYSENGKAWYAANRERATATRRKWLDDNRDRVRECAAKWFREEKHTNPVFRVGVTIRNRILNGIKRESGRMGEVAKSARTEEMLGCTYAQACQHIESLWQPGMTWRNHAPRGWHIDHITPLAAFDLRDPEQQRIAFHYTNLQPLWARDNQVKGARAA